ncbi:TIGR03768 family metallophosphoesterase [Methylotuvimicrobium buryatense]|uniref:TIGR03768 family metallophosphoesterase n=1 Tax=Methylotuvimicrobium buryatense TaxID=95641 RepID=A0A4P9UXC1_METBY|nr:TIGR03768 family metallophosphoesterase [Methylotuvimicrobium buryatense]QCW84476.1 TIGR03768 family metallophosphoesterase [Methylotuvimicrobium buryatense]
MINDDLKSRENSMPGSGISRRDFIKVTAGSVTCFSLSSWMLGCVTHDSGFAKVASYPIDSDVYTTLDRTIKPEPTSGAILPEYLNRISEYDQNGYGVWSYGEALVCEQRFDIMGVYNPPESNHPTTLLRFFSISDIHITDKESPSQLIYMQQLNQCGFEAGVTSVYSPVMMYTPHVLDAAIQTVNALHQNQPIDFGISLGDACNSTQYNELRWYIDVIDGKVIKPSSGAHEGADDIDYQKPFKAAGLDPSIPWYQAIGNHDHFWLGSIPPDGKYGDDPSLRESCTSDEVIAMSNALCRANDIYSYKTPEETLYYMGVIDGATPNGEIVKYGQVENFSAPPKVVADSDRYSLTKMQWVKEFFNTSTEPVGHGFSLVPTGQEAGFACYSFVPKVNIPIKVIVLDNTQREDDQSTSIHGHGFLDEARWQWLKAELAEGDDQDQLMIIAAHIPIGVQKAGTYMEWFDNSANPDEPQNAVDLPELLEELHSHPNLLMWIAGHRHVNAVKAFESPDPVDAPEKGFWQVETSSLHDFPQQLRMFDIKLNSDYTISIVTTNVDPAAKEGTPAWTSRKYVVAAQQIVNTESIYQADNRSNYLVDPATQNEARVDGKVVMDPSIRPMPTGSYNAELLKQLSPAMMAKMQVLFPTI